jgi:MFS superfamily sulfate permease-like transporter
MAEKKFRFEFFRQDLAAGFVVFLVALPLCLGIALASGVDPIAGIITGIVAGLLVSVLSGSELSVSGPAAGLTVTVIHGQQAIGSFEGLLVATALSGVFQILFGGLRAGLLATFFPTSVIKGMLAGIGIIIAFKQIPHAIGWHQEVELEESIFCLLPGSCAHSTTGSFMESLSDLSLIPLLVSVLSIVLLIFWERSAARGSQFFKLFPGALAAVLLGVALNYVVGSISPELMLHKDAGQLVDLPRLSGVFDLFDGGPTLSSKWLLDPTVWSTAITIALIGSIETLLCLEATDKLDPLRRVSRPNRELIAQGIGNITAGCLGGIPMTSVIVRSSANIYAGGRTRLSGFIHGLFLLVSVLALPGLLTRIPLAALAAVLILVGYKLANVKLIASQYRAGMDQFLPFAVTAISVVSFDLLSGVAIGTLVGLLVVLKMNYHSAFSLIRDDNQFYLRFAKDVSFLQKVSIKKALARIPDNSTVFIDGGGAMFIDYDILEIIEDFRRSSVDRKIDVNVRNLNPVKSAISA